MFGDEVFEKDKVVYCEISSYMGFAIGASHTYGELKGDREKGKFERNSVTLMRILTTSQAAELNAGGRYGLSLSLGYKKGDHYRGFESREDVIKNALNCWKEHFPNADILIEGDPAVVEPQKILACSDTAEMNYLNDLADQYEKSGGSESEDDTSREIWNSWMKRICKYSGIDFSGRTILRPSRGAKK